MCAIALKSMTYALKAKNVLDEYYIDCEIIKLDQSMTKKGCAYGIKFSCVNINSVYEALKARSVRYSELIRL